MKVECSKCHEWVEMNGRKQKCSVCGWDLLKDYNDEMVTKDAPKPEPQTSPSETESTTSSNKDKQEKESSIKSHSGCLIVIILVIVTFIVAFLIGRLLSMRDAANNAPYLHNMK